MNDRYIDANGTVWTRPTAEAYARTCVALQREKDDSERWAASAIRLEKRAEKAEAELAASKNGFTALLVKWTNVTGELAQAREVMRESLELLDINLEYNRGKVSRMLRDALPLRAREAEYEMHVVSRECGCQGCVFGIENGLEGKTVKRLVKHS